MRRAELCRAMYRDFAYELDLANYYIIMYIKCIIIITVILLTEVTTRIGFIGTCYRGKV